MAPSELSRQCLERRIAEQKTIAAEVQAWCVERNNRQISVDWHFTTDDARAGM